MKLFPKLFLCFLLLTVVSLGAAGAVVVTASFQNALASQYREAGRRFDLVRRSFLEDSGLAADLNAGTAGCLSLSALQELAQRAAGDYSAQLTESEALPAYPDAVTVSVREEDGRRLLDAEGYLFSAGDRHFSLRVEDEYSG